MRRVYKYPDDGYTLLELLVVLTIISLIVLSAPTAYTLIVPNFQVRQYANDLANLARELKRESVQHNVVTALVFDPAGETISSSGWHDPALARDLDVPLNVSISFERQMHWKSPTDNHVEFYPSGGTSGGIFLVERNNIQVEVTIDWLSGSVKVRQ